VPAEPVPAESVPAENANARCRRPPADGSARRARLISPPDESAADESMASEHAVPQLFVTAGSQDQLFVVRTIPDCAIYSLDRQPNVTFLSQARLQQ
jgi:hypothetical protein